jgi:acetyltransferase-like isoleucine patch superfamily enzyme
VDPTTKLKPSEPPPTGLQRRKLIPPTIHGNVTVGEYCVLGSRAEARLNSTTESVGLMGDGSVLGNFVSLYEGVKLQGNVVVEDNVRIGYDTLVGFGTRIMYGAFICDRVQIGTESRIAGFVCDTTVIGDGCTSMGTLVHAYSDPAADWWGPDEASPVLQDGACVGMGALVVGGVTIGTGAYVAAGAIVTKNVPANTLVTGVDRHRPRSSTT